ncbi:MAG: glycosyltransferase, partial [Gammaproteobacteria bacterium]|nr:glycosyltransferase [Gammaproteobacteria bacterium]
MNILHIGKYYPPFSGGIENFMGQLLPLLASAGHHITALVHNHCSGQSVQSEIMKHVKVIRVPSYGRLLYAPISPAFPFYLHRILKKSKPDLLHIHLPNTSAFWLLLLPSAHKIPWIIHWHSDVIGASPNKLVRLAYYLYQPLERLLLKNSQHIIVTSPHYQQSSEVLKPWLKKTQVIPLGISLKSTLLADQYKNKAEQLWSRNFKKKPHRLLSIGRLTYYKGHQYLIRAMLDLPDSYLIIIGEGEEYQSLTRLITELKLEQQVLLTGKLNDQDLHAL